MRSERPRPARSDPAAPHHPGGPHRSSQVHDGGTAPSLPAPTRWPGGTGLFVAMVVLVTAVPLAAPVAAAGDLVRYEAPVDAALVDPFRPPAHPYGPGNRGIDYATAPGHPVRAAAPGVVTFAGQIGTSRHVVVLHADGIRTSYSFLAETTVRRGDEVSAGQVVGATAGALHFGARAGDAYLDPALLLSGSRWHVHLVPHEGRGPLPAVEERAGLVRALRHAGRAAGGALVGAGWAAGSAAGEWLRAAAATSARYALDDLHDRLRLALLAVHYARAVDPAAGAVATLAAAWDWWTARGDCTPATEPVPPRDGRRILVLVGGLGSAGGKAAVLGVDAEALGYDPADVVQASYRGGRVPGVGALTGVPVRDYTAADSTGDLRASAAHVRDLLEAIRHAHPGVPVDVVAHSQGGVVTRLALAGAGPLDPTLPEISAVVTLGSPHEGANLATAGVALATSGTPGQLAALGLGRLSGGTADPTRPAVQQLAETSPLVRELSRAPVPDHIPLTSIAVSGDLVVPALRSRVDGATNVVVPLGGARAHDRMTTDPAVQREVALALAGRPPGCRRALEALTSAVVAHRIALVQDGAGAAILGAGLRSGAALTPTVPLPHERR